MIIALAGRRIDALDAKEGRFPLHMVPQVKERLKIKFQQLKTTYVVCAAACGADLIALEVGESLGIRCRIVLSHSVAQFRAKSVVDRPGNWGLLYDRLIAVAASRGDLVLLDLPDGDGAYLEANEAILDQAVSLSGGRVCQAIVVWEDTPRDGDDITAAFAQSAAKRGFQVSSISTLIEEAM